MKKIKITVMRMANYEDLRKEYEKAVNYSCYLKLGQEFIADGWRMPEGFCEAAWAVLSPYVMTLAHGGKDIFDGWMINEKSAMISCNDGFRPVSFLIEALDEDATDM